MTAPAPEELGGLLEFAVELAREAGRATLAHFGERLSAVAKGDGTPVTVADRAAEAILRRQIQTRFPRDGILGEEFGEENPGAQRRWILDPIDGTRSFVCGVPLYSVLVGLEVADESVLGVIHFPALEETVAAALGQGCHLNGVRRRVSGVTRLTEAVALTSDPGWVAESDVAEGWDRLVRTVDFARSWGDGYGHAMVATGRAEIMLDPKDLQAWDAAPLLPILTEADGRFTDLQGRATIHGGSGLSTNGHLHPQVLEILTGRATPARDG